MRERLIAKTYSLLSVLRHIAIYEMRNTLVALAAATSAGCSRTQLAGLPDDENLLLPADYLEPIL